MKVVPVLSGKGGVGKTTVATHLALALHAQGFRVGLLDIDLTGPSVPNALGLQDSQVMHAPQGWLPVHASDPEDRFSVMSIAFLLSSNKDAVIWRGPKKSAMILQFLRDVVWGTLDYLIIDTPPGTSDEHISLVEYLRDSNLLQRDSFACIVTTPQQVSLQDVRKELSFCKKVGLPVAGIVENMSGFICPCCGDRTDIFSTGGGESLAAEWNVPFLGRIPIDPASATSLESSTESAPERLFERFAATDSACYSAIAARLCDMSLEK